MSAKLETNDDGHTFKAWFAIADNHVSVLAGVGLEDLPDGPSWDSWNDSVDPVQYAEMMLEEEGFPFL